MTDEMSGCDQPKPEQKPCRFHPDARMLPVVEVIDNRTGKRSRVQFCMACDMESKPPGRQEFAS